MPFHWFCHAAAQLQASRPYRRMLDAVESGKYLGVTLTNDLSWKNHVEATAAKASKTLDFLRRNL